MYIYYLNNIIPFLVYKLYLLKLKDIPYIKLLKISIQNKNIKINHLSIIRSCFFLEHFTNKLPKTVYFTQYEKKNRFISSNTQIVYNNKEIFSFFLIFICVYLEFLIKKNIKVLHKEISLNSMYTFSIKNLSIFNFIPFSFYNWTATINFTLKFKGTRLQFKYLMNALNLPFNF